MGSKGLGFRVFIKTLLGFYKTPPSWGLGAWVLGVWGLGLGVEGSGGGRAWG